MLKVKSSEKEDKINVEILKELKKLKEEINNLKKQT